MFAPLRTLLASNSDQGLSQNEKTDRDVDLDLDGHRNVADPHHLK
jgi:hypothetical protein